MLDIGFGLIDRRTVIAVIFSMLLAKIIWNGEIPVDTTDTGSLFFSVITLTGYIYLARSIYRLPVALYLASRTSLYRLTDITKGSSNKLHDLNSAGSSFRLDWLKKAGITIYLYLLTIGFWILLFPLLTLNFERNSWVWQMAQDQEQDIFGVSSPILTLEICRILDRIGLILISTLATFPTLKPIYTQLGTFGLGFMLVVFVFSGSFSAIVEDILDQGEKVSSPSYDRVEVKTSQSDPLYVEIVNKNNYPPLPVEVKNVVIVQDQNP